MGVLEGVKGICIESPQAYLFFKQGSDFSSCISMEGPTLVQLFTCETVEVENILSAFKILNFVVPLPLEGQFYLFLSL